MRREKDHRLQRGGDSLLGRYDRRGDEVGGIVDGLSASISIVFLEELSIDTDSKLVKR